MVQKDTKQYHNVVVLAGISNGFYTNPVISETKSVANNLLAKQKLGKSSQREESDLKSTIQPVLQLLIAGTMQSRMQCVNCFYMTRESVRPYVYIPSEDLLLSTRRSYLWNTGDNLWLRGCVLIALFTRSNQLFDSQKLPPNLPKTNFKAASKKLKFSVSERVAHCA